MVPAKALKDPWGRPYEYDLNGPKHEGLQPGIWSKGPDPKDPKGAIGNRQSAGPAKKIPWMRIEKPDSLVAIHANRPLEVAVETATVYLMD